MFGDPHIYTFDNQAYTFNGLGEYVLVRANSPKVKLDVQGRFEQVSVVCRYPGVDICRYTRVDI